MLEIAKNLWRQFGFWHWILAPLAAAEAVIVVLYELALARGVNSIRIDNLELGAKIGAVIFLAVLAISIALRFKAYSADDDPFGSKIYDRMNKIWFFAVGVMLLGVLMLVAGTFLMKEPFVAIPLFIVGLLFLFAFIGIEFVNNWVYRALYWRSWGIDISSDESLERWTDIRNAATQHALGGIAFCVSIIAVISVAAYFSQ